MDSKLWFIQETPTDIGKRVKNMFFPFSDVFYIVFRFNHPDNIYIYRT